MKVVYKRVNRSFFVPTHYLIRLTERSAAIIAIGFEKGDRLYAESQKNNLDLCGTPNGDVWCEFCGAKQIRSNENH